MKERFEKMLCLVAMRKCQKMPQKLSTESSGINKASSTITNVRKDTDSNTHKKKLLKKKRTEQKEN